MSGENSRLFVISPCFYLFINFGFVFVCFCFFFLQVRCGCKVGESLERTNNEISEETRAMNKECTKTTSALSFFFFFLMQDFSFTYLLHLINWEEKTKKGVAHQ